jgi:fucose permease
MKDEHRAGPEHGITGHPLRSRRVVLLGLIGFSCFLIEGGAMDWSALYLRESLGTTAATAAFALVAFSIGMVTARFVGDRLTASLGPVTLLRAGGVGAVVSLAVGLGIREPSVTIAAFGVLGVSLASVVPTAFSAAGNTFIGTGTALAWVVTMSYLGSVLGPAAIGLSANVVGLRLALLIPALFAAVIAVAAPWAGAPAAPGTPP